MARIGIFGGSFNPPHIGHILAAQQCKDVLQLDRVLLIPASIPPHKQMPKGSPDAQMRLELTRLAADGMEGFEVSDLELRRTGASYTVDTVRELKTIYPDDELYLLMGTDMFLCFDEWKQPDEIVRYAVPVCMMRVEQDAELHRQLAAKAQTIEEKFGVKPILLDNEVEELSSTEVRRLLFFGCADRCIPEKALRKIEQEGLYGTGESCRQLPYEKLKEISLSLHKPKRVPHAEGCAETAEKLAERYGASREDALRAGILHDVTKALNTEQQVLLLRHFGSDATEEELATPALLHSRTAAIAAERIFGEKDEICSAIRWHTTGRPDMTILEKILYIADYMEPTRSFPGVERIREAVWRDLDAGVLLGLERTIRYVSEKGTAPSEISLLAYQQLKNCKGK